MKRTLKRVHRSRTNKYVIPVRLHKMSGETIGVLSMLRSDWLSYY